MVEPTAEEASASSEQDRIATWRRRSSGLCTQRAPCYRADPRPTTVIEMVESNAPVVGLRSVAMSSPV
jgi:hypothetical protein